MPETSIPTPETTIPGLLAHITSFEKDLGSNLEVTSLRSEQSSANPNDGVNFLCVNGNESASALPEAQLKIIGGTPQQQDAEIQQISETNLLVDYAQLFIDGSFQNVLFFRPGRTTTWKGKMSHFGGKDDSTLGEDEPLAIVQNDNFELYKKFFMNEEKGGNFPHAKNLNPDTPYIACRWDYRVTPRTELKKCMIMVTNPANGESRRAEAVDWGPDATLDRVADLSPALESALGLATGQVCEVVITLPIGLLQEMITTPNGQPGGGVKVLSETQVIALFDDPNPTTPAGGGAVTPRPGFVSDNITTVGIPSLAGIKGAPANLKVECHRKVAEALAAAFREINDRGMTSLILSWDGMYVPRHINRDTGKPLSRHTWGIAFDINAKFNPYKAKPAKPGTQGSVHDLVPIFEEHGFFWGGYFKTSPDGMHFEWGRDTV